MLKYVFQICNLPKLIFVRFVNFRYYLRWGWSAPCPRWTAGQLHHAGRRAWICALSSCRWQNKSITLCDESPSYHITHSSHRHFHLMSSATIGESGHGGGDSGARQSRRIIAEDLPWALTCGPGGAFWATCETPGQWWLVHLTHFSLRSLQRLLPTGLQHCQSRDSPVSRSTDYYCTCGGFVDDQYYLLILNVFMLIA